MTRITEFKMIVALCRGGGIGFEGVLPWPKLARDLRFFAEITSSSIFPYNSAVVMGRRTWDSIPASSRPLKFRDNFVISALHTPDDESDATTTGVTFLKNLSDIHEHSGKYDTVWFIGGASIYEQVIATPSSSSVSGFTIDDIYVTFVDESYEHDTAFSMMYQYDSVEEWQKMRNDPLNRAIWCWTGADHIPKFVSFFTQETFRNNLYRVMDVDRDFISRITQPSDMKAIQERRSPNTIFLRLRRVVEV